MVSYEHLLQVKAAKREEERMLQLRGRLETEILALEREESPLLEKCLKERRELDHRLDAIEELASESLEEIRKKLILQLEDREEAETLLEEIARRREVESLIEELNLQFKEFLGHLEALFESRERVKKRSILSYVFGSNPNAVINRSLAEAKEGAETMQSQLSLLLEQPSARAPLKEGAISTYQLLTKFKESVEEGWSFEKIDKLFLEQKPSLLAGFTRLLEERSAEVAQRHAEEAQLDRLLREK